MKKAEITYPCEWSFRVIGTNKDNLAGDIKNIMSERAYSVEESNRKGKYISLNLKLTVDSRQERNLIFAALKSSVNVTMVL